MLKIRCLRMRLELYGSQFECSIYWCLREKGSYDLCDTNLR